MVEAHHTVMLCQLSCITPNRLQLTLLICHLNRSFSRCAIFSHSILVLHFDPEQFLSSISYRIHGYKFLAALNLLNTSGSALDAHAVVLTNGDSCFRVNHKCR